MKMEHSMWSPFIVKCSKILERSRPDLLKKKKRERKRKKTTLKGCSNFVRNGGEYI